MEMHPTPQSSYGHGDEDVIGREIEESQRGGPDFQKVYDHKAEDELEKEIEEDDASSDDR